MRGVRAGVFAKNEVYLPRGADARMFPDGAVMEEVGDIITSVLNEK